MSIVLTEAEKEALKCAWCDGVGECYHTQTPHTCPACKGTGKMMNTTKSGSIAVGAPMSLARLQQELEYYAGPEGTIEALGATDEGIALICKYIEYKGGHGTSSTMDAVSRMSFDELMALDSYLYGALVALRYSMAGRVTLAKMAQETTPDQWVSIFSELHKQIKEWDEYQEGYDVADLEYRLEAAERREKGLREALQKWVKYDANDQQDHVQLMFDYADALDSTKAALAQSQEVGA